MFFKGKIGWSIARLFPPPSNLASIYFLIFDGFSRNIRLVTIPLRWPLLLPSSNGKQLILMCCCVSVKEVKAVFVCNQVKIGSNGRKIHTYVEKIWKMPVFPTWLRLTFLHGLSKQITKIKSRCKMGWSGFLLHSSINHRDLLKKGTFCSPTWGKVGYCARSYANFYQLVLKFLN